MSTFTSEPGARLADRYRLEDRIRATGSWSAWKAIDETLARPVTVITFVPEFARTTAVITAARAASRLTDSRLAQVFDVEHGADRSYIVLEWVAGDSLDDLLSNGPLDPAHGVGLITEASEALAGAHAAGLAHLCLTPASLRWTPSGGVKIIGLGIDAALDGIASGEPALADTQGLGRLLYATLTGHWAGLQATTLPPAPLADGQPCSPRQVRAGVPAAIDAVACDALFQRPRRGRPPITTPALLAEALAEVAPASLPIGPRPMDGFVPHRPPADGGHDGSFPWLSDRQAAGRERRGRPSAAPGQRAVTTSAVIGIVVVLILVAIGVGGWLLSRNKGGATSASHHHRSHSATAATAVLRPTGAYAFDNGGGAGLAIDQNPRTYWSTSYYIGDPVFGGLKTGTGLVVDLGQQLKISQVQILFGPNVGADVQIKVSASSPGVHLAASLPPVAQATGVGNSHTFALRSQVTGRYIVIWFTKLPRMIGSANRYQAEIYNIAVRGSG
jgi:serine/threonine protein kinase